MKNLALGVKSSSFKDYLSPTFVVLRNNSSIAKWQDPGSLVDLPSHLFINFIPILFEWLQKITCQGQL